MFVSVRKICVGAVVGVVMSSGVADAVLAPPPDDIPVTVDAVGSTGRDPSLVLDAAGFPVISYFDQTNGDLRLMHCDDAGCVGEDDTDAVTVDAAGFTGQYPSLALDAAGFPVISYYDQTNGDLRLVHCDDADCAGGEVPVTVDAAGSTGRDSSLVLDGAGFPVISYYDLSNGDLRLMRCDDPDCSGEDDTDAVTVDSDGDTGVESSLVLDSAGFPVISYHDGYSGHVLLVHCSDPGCVGAEGTAVFIGSNNNNGWEPSLALDADGFPVVSYYDQSNNVLRLAHCGEPDCAGGYNTARSIDDGNARYPSMVLDADGFPVIAYYDATNRDLRLLHCNDPDCLPDTTGPIATINLAPGQTATAGSGPVEFAVTFDEVVFGFDNSAVIVTGTAGATAATVSGSGAEYIVTIETIPGDGSVTIAIVEDVVEDAYDNYQQLPTVVVADSVTIETVVPQPVVGPRELTGSYASMSGTEGSVGRLYMAVFNRQPDGGGHAYWVARAGNGLSLRAMADFFISSPEFDDTYNTLDNAAFVDLLYLNVMNRNGDAGGVRFWNEQLDGGMARSLVVLQFSESPEFRKLTGTT